MTEFIILALVLTYLVWSIYLEDTLPKKYRQRNCMGKNWKAVFPKNSKNEIRSFLTFFTDAFGFDEKDKLKFEPNDKLLSIYRELHPKKWQADDMEFDTLAEDLQKHHGIDFKSLWHDDLTLGELYHAFNKAQ
jgi:propanediol dehydratase small subunit